MFLLGRRVQEKSVATMAAVHSKDFAEVVLEVRKHKGGATAVSRLLWTPLYVLLELCRGGKRGSSLQRLHWLFEVYCFKKSTLNIVCKMYQVISRQTLLVGKFQRKGSIYKWNVVFWQPVYLRSQYWVNFLICVYLNFFAYVTKKITRGSSMIDI